MARYSSTSNKGPLFCGSGASCSKVGQPQPSVLVCVCLHVCLLKIQGSQLLSTQPRFLKKPFPICGQAVGKFGEKFRSFEQPTPEVCCAGPHQEVLGHSKKIYSYIALQCALILLCLTPDDFTRQGESAGAQWVIEWNFIRSEEQLRKLSAAGQARS